MVEVGSGDLKNKIKKWLKCGRVSTSDLGLNLVRPTLQFRTYGMLREPPACYNTDLTERVIKITNNAFSASEIIFLQKVF